MKLLHIDSGILGTASVSRQLSANADFPFLRREPPQLTRSCRSRDWQLNMPTFRNPACSQSGTHPFLVGRSASLPCLLHRHLPPMHLMDDHRLSLQTTLS